MADVKNSSLATDLISYWELEEAGGTRVDSHGVNDLTDNNTVLSAAGIQGDGADFETSNSEWLSITDAAQTGLDITGDISVSAWIKLESTGTGMIAAKDQFDGGNQSWHWYTTGGNLFARFSDDGSNNSGHVINVSASSVGMTTGIFYHVVITYDASTGTCKMYKDGVEQTVSTSGTIGTTLHDNAIPFTIGRRERPSPEWYFDGIIDEVGVWSRTLTSGNVTSLYNSGSGIPYESAPAASTLKKATVNASDVAATLSDYPSYVDLSRLGITTLAEAQSVRVYADSAKTTEWAREIVSATEMHVKIPSLTTTTDIYVDYDGVRADYAVGATFGRNAVWSDYAAVWHTNSHSTITNSTGGTSGAAFNTVSGDIVSGPFAEAIELLSNGDYVSMPCANVFPFTLQMWFKRNGSANLVSDAGIERTTAIGNFSKFQSIRLRGSDSKLNGNTRDGSAPNAGTLSTGTYMDNAWHKTEWVTTSSNSILYVDGVNDGNSATTQSDPSLTTDFFFNRTYDSSPRYAKATYAEFRVKNDEISSDWLTTEYNNQNDEATFWGTWTDAGGGGGAPRRVFNIS